MPVPVHEERGCAVHPASDAGDEVLPDPGSVGAALDLAGKPPHVEPQPRLCEIQEELLVVQRRLVLVDEIVHLPELPLRACGLRHLGSELSPWMNLRKREVAEDKT